MREGDLVTSPWEDAARRVRWQLLVRLLVAAALASLLGLLFDAVIGTPDPALERRTSRSPRADGFRGMMELLPRLGRAPGRHHVSWGQLPEAEAGRSALLLLDPLPFEELRRLGSPLDGTNARALMRWVEAGGHLLIALAGRHSVRLVAGLAPSGASLSELDPLVVELLPDAPAPRGRAALGSPLAADPPLPVAPGSLAALGSRDVGLAGAWLSWMETPAFGPGAKPVEAGPPELPVFEEKALPAEWKVRVRLGEAPLVIEQERGRGKVWLASSAYPFTNLALARGGSGPLVAGLVHELDQGGRRALLVDEACHALHRRRGLLGPLMAGPLGPPFLAGLALLGLVAWRGAVREGSPRPVRAVARRAKEEFVLALGELLRRGGRHRAAAASLLEAWRHRLPPGVDPAALAGLERSAERVRDEQGLQAFAREARELMREARERARS